MADTKISDLPAASALAGTEAAPVVQGGVTSKATATQIKTFVESTYASGVVTFLTTPSGANLASALTTALPASKGGTGLTALGTGVATALGVNVGSAGAPVVLNGAGGTPSSLTGTNITGIPPAGVTGTAAILGANTFTAGQTITEAVGASGLTLTGATQTSSFPVINATQTWNNAATTFKGIYLNVTDTASAAASLLLDLQVGGASKFELTKGGFVYLSGTSAGLIVEASNGTQYAQLSPGGVTMQSGGFIGVHSGLSLGGSPDAYLSRGGVATWQLGAANAASPVAQTLQAQGSRSGTDTNVGGASYTIRAGTGTGTGTESSLILQSPVAVASGTGAQTNTTGLTIKAGCAIRPSYTVATLPAAATVGAGAMAWVTDATATTFLSTVAGGGANKVPVSCDGTLWLIG